MPDKITAQDRLGRRAAVTAFFSAWTLSIAYLLLVVTKQQWIQTVLVGGVSLYMASLIGAFITVFAHGDMRQAYTARTIAWILGSMFAIVFQGLIIVGIMRTMKH